MTKPLLVTDPSLAGLPMVADALAANEAAGLPTGLFSDVKPNPVGQNVDDGLKAYRDGGHDGVIAWGGGSGLDAAKAVALMAGQSRPLWDFEDRGDNWLRADPDGIAPIVAVPTTAGTGSEVGRASVILDESDHTKKIVFHPKMLPAIVISDPELTVGLPAHLTAATGMDALAHCLEAYCAPSYHPMAEGIAVEGLRLVKDWLPTAVADGSNIEARAHMLVAASMGSTAFQKGLGAIHSLSHPVGALYDTHHGLTNAVVMPYVLVFNRSAIEERLTRLAAWLDLPNPSFGSVMDWVLGLRKTFKMPHTLADMGVTTERLDELSEMAAQDPTASGNPIPVGAAEMKEMFTAAIEGRL
jgi:alcohol dehydrogenase class IV